jgi:hypothetical protein
MTRLRRSTHIAGPIWVPPQLEEEEAEEVALSVEEYKPPDLSEEEAI